MSYLNDMFYKVDKNKVPSIDMVQYPDGCFVPKECCTFTNPVTSGGQSRIDDLDLPCFEGCEYDCNTCIITKLMNEYAYMSYLLKNKEREV